MTSREPSNPVVHRLVAAINDGDRDAFLATLAAPLTSPDPARPWHANPTALCGAAPVSGRLVRGSGTGRHRLSGGCQVADHD